MEDPDGDLDDINDLGHNVSFHKRKKRSYQRASKDPISVEPGQESSESDFAVHLKNLLSEVLELSHFIPSSDGDDEYSSQTESEYDSQDTKRDPDPSNQDIEADGVELVKCLPLIERKGKLAAVTLQMTYRSVFRDLKYAKVIAGYTNDQIFDMLDHMPLCGDPDVAFTVLVQRYVAAGYVTKDRESTYRKLKDMYKSLPEKNIRQRNYIEGSMCYVLAAFYMSDQLGKAWRYIQKAKQEMQFAERSSWSALVYEREANILTACAQARPSAKHMYMCAAFESYRLAREHYLSNPCNSEEHVMYNEAKYMLQMLYLRLQMPLPYVVVNLKDRNIMEEHAQECDLSEVDLMQAERILQGVKNLEFEFSDEYKYHHQYYITTAEVYLEMRKAQLYLQQGNMELSFRCVHRAIQLCNDWGKGCCQDQVLMDTIVVKNRLGRVLAKLQEKICASVMDGLFKNIKTKNGGDSDLQA